MTIRSDGAQVEKAAGAALSFEMRFCPSAELIGIVRQFVVAFYRRVTHDEDIASRLAVATHELLENAVKYSSDGAANLFVQVHPSSRAVDVKVSNRASDAQIALLRARFDEIGDAADAQQHYAALLKRTALVQTGSGGLGLARIWAESEMAMRLTTAGDSVEIHAHGAIGTQS